MLHDGLLASLSDGLEGLSARVRVDTAAAFYVWSAALLWGIWSAFSATSCTDWHKRGLVVPVLTRPSWAPRWLATRLRSPPLYLAIVHGTPWVLFCAGLFGMYHISTHLHTLYHATCVCGHR